MVVGEVGEKVMKMRAGRTVPVLGRVTIVVGEVVFGNEWGGIAGAGAIALHRRRSGSGAD